MFLALLLTLNSTFADPILPLMNQEIAILEAQALPVDYQYRLFELYIEKVKYLRKQENAAFLKAIQTKPDADKSEFFAESKLVSQKAQKLGSTIIASNPAPQIEAQIFYALGIESIDHGDEKMAAKYFDQANQHAPENQEILSAKADAYFNIKRYKEASPLYEKLLTDKKNYYRTKILHQYAWTLFKMGKFPEALDAIEESYLLTQGEGYLKNDTECTTAMINFYSVTNNGQRGVQFLKQHKVTTPNLIRAVRKFRSHGLTTPTRDLFAHIRTQTLTQEQHYEVLSEELLFALQHKDEDQLFAYLKDVKTESPISEEAKIELKNYFLENFSIKANLVAKHDGDPTYLGKCENYIAELTKIDRDQQCAYHFNLGELYHALNKTQDAIVSYQNSFETTSPVCAQNKQKEILETFFHYIERGQAGKKTDELKVYSYKNFIRLFPDDNKTPAIYKNLVSFYIEKKDMQTAFTELTAFSSLKPQNTDAKDLYKVIFDHYFTATDDKNVHKLVMSANEAHWGFEAEEKRGIQKKWLEIHLKISQKHFENKDYAAALGTLDTVDVSGMDSEIQSQVALNKSVIFFHQKAYKPSLKNLDLAVTLHPELMDQKISAVPYEILSGLPLESLHHSLALTQSYLNKNCKAASKENSFLIKKYMPFMMEHEPKLQFPEEFMNCITEKDAGELKKNILVLYLHLEQSDSAIEMISKNIASESFLHQTEKQIRSILWQKESHFAEWGKNKTFAKIFREDFELFENFQKWTADLKNLEQFVGNLSLKTESSWAKINRVLDDLAFFNSKGKKYLKSGHEMLVIATMNAQNQTMKVITNKMTTSDTLTAEITEYRNQVLSALNGKITENTVNIDQLKLAEGN